VEIEEAGEEMREDAANSVVLDKQESGRGEDEIDDVWRPETREAAGKVFAERRTWLACEAMPCEWESEDESADQEEELHAAIAVAEEQSEAMIARSNRSAALTQELAVQVKENHCGSSDEAEAVDFGNPMTTGCDAAKLHEPPHQKRPAKIPESSVLPAAAIVSEMRKFEVARGSANEATGSMYL
jgi:hypothetical protein